MDAMKILLSIAARERRFSKLVRQSRLQFNLFAKEFSAMELRHPIHEAILIGVTDDKPLGYFEEIKNSDGFFQVQAGVGEWVTEREFLGDLYEILERVLRACPFAAKDKDDALDLLFRWKNRITGRGE